MNRLNIFNMSYIWGKIVNKIKKFREKKKLLKPVLHKILI